MVAASESGTLKIVENGENAYAVTNTYTRKTEDVTVTKTFSGITAEDLAELKDFAIAYSSDDKEQGTASGRLAIADAEVSGTTYSWTIEKAKVGETLSFTESGYEHDDYTVVAASESGTLKIVENGENAYTVTNTYTRKLATLTVTKVIKVPDGFKENEDQVFDFTVELSEVPTAYKPVESVTIDGTVLTFSLKHNESVEIANLPVGATYTVSEEPVKGYELAPDTVTDGTILETGSKVTITNTYVVEPLTNVTITAKKILKVAEGATAPKIDGKYTFDLTGADGTPLPATTSYKNPDSTGGSVSFGPITYSLPGTYTYTVTESGEVKYVTNDADAAKGKTATVTVTDNHDGTMSAKVENVTFTNYVQSAKIEKAADKTTARFGDTVTYTITVTNTSEVAISGVEVKDTFTVTKKDGSTVDTIRTFTTGDLAIGESQKFTYTYPVAKEDKSLTNVAVSEIPGENPPPVVVPVQSTKVEKEADKSTAKPGDVITYTVTVTNDGEADVPAGTKVTDTMTITKTDGTTATIVTTLATTKVLKSGESEELTYTYTVVEEDKSLTNVAVSEIPGENPPPVDVDVTHPGLQVIKTPDRTSGLTMGTTVTFTVIVRNTGDVEISNIVLSDILNGDTSMIDAEPFTLAAGASRVFTYTHTITAADIARGYVLNVATVTGRTPDGDSLNPPPAVNRLIPGTPIRPTPPTPPAPVPVPAGPAGDNLIIIDDFETPLGLGGVYINIGECFE